MRGSWREPTRLQTVLFSRSIGLCSSLLSMRSVFLETDDTSLRPNRTRSSTIPQLPSRLERRRVRAARYSPTAMLQWPERAHDTESSLKGIPYCQDQRLWHEVERSLPIPARTSRGGRAVNAHGISLEPRYGSNAERRRLNSTIEHTRKETILQGETLRDRAGAVCDELAVPDLIDACQVTGQLPIDVGQMVRRR